MKLVSDRPGTRRGKVRIHDDHGEYRRRLWVRKPMERRLQLEDVILRRADQTLLWAHIEYAEYRQPRSVGRCVLSGLPNVLRRRLFRDRRGSLICIPAGRSNCIWSSTGLPSTGGSFKKGPTATLSPPKRWTEEGHQYFPNLLEVAPTEKRGGNSNSRSPTRLLRWRFPVITLC